MKPIEIHIEGYKIVISKDDEEKTIEDKMRGYVDGKTTPIIITTNPPQVVPNLYSPQPGVWWEHPNATWTADDVLNGTPTASEFHPVRDCMVGKVTDEDATD